MKADCDVLKQCKPVPDVPAICYINASQLSNNASLKASGVHVSSAPSQARRYGTYVRYLARAMKRERGREYLAY